MLHPENLKPAKKGEIRNPKGKEKGTLNFKTILKRYLDVKIKLDNKTPFNNAGEIVGTKDMVVLKLLKLALEGNLNAIKLVKEWIEGLDDSGVEGDYEMKIIKIRRNSFKDDNNDKKSLNIAEEYNVNMEKNKQEE